MESMAAGSHQLLKTTRRLLEKHFVRPETLWLRLSRHFLQLSRQTFRPAHQCAAAIK
jgi:hypothetical protein